MKLKFVAALLAGSALVVSVPAFAQAAAPADQPAPTEPDQSDATADAAIANAQSVDEAEAKIELLQAQVEALQASIEQVKASMVKATPTWKGGPQFDDKEAGWSFKPKGLIQWDAGYVGFPRGNEIRSGVAGTNTGGLNYQNLGFNTRGRRLTIGADGTLPGGFRYSAEFNFANASLDYEDIFIAYDFKNSPLTLQIGHIYPFSSLETMTSSKYTSFMERAGITDAFNYNRRLGLAFTATDKKADSWTIQGGIFSEPINDATWTRTGWQASLRAIYSPMLGDTRLHVAANLQHRENRRESRGATYQERPYTQTTDQRFIGTGAIAAKGDDVAGVELAAIHKSLHFAAEAQKVWLHGTYDAAGFAAQNAQLDTNDLAAGAVYNGNPSFWGGYAEIGYFLTGETRNYKGGAFQRLKVLHPFNEGGWGAFQINARADYVDLSDKLGGAVIAPPAGASGYGLGSNSTFLNGGKQLGLLGSVIWNPTDYVRFMAQYDHVQVTGGPRATVSTPTVIGLFPVGTTTAPEDRKYNVDVFTMRAQVDF